MAILSNDKLNDPRVVRTRKALREAFCTLSLTTPPNELMISHITEAAGVNRKTFYLHYEEVDDLVDDVALATASEIQSSFVDDTSEKDLSANILQIYSYLESHQPLMNILLFNPSYLSVSRKLTDAILSLDFFKSFYASNTMPAVIKGYFSSIFSIYKTWCVEKDASDDSDKNMSLEELASRCSNMLLQGIEE